MDWRELEGRWAMFFDENVQATTVFVHEVSGKWALVQDVAAIGGSVYYVNLNYIRVIKPAPMEEATECA